MSSMAAGLYFYWVTFYINLILLTGCVLSAVALRYLISTHLRDLTLIAHVSDQIRSSCLLVLVSLSDPNSAYLQPAKAKQDREQLNKYKLQLALTDSFNMIYSQNL